MKPETAQLTLYQLVQQIKTTTAMVDKGEALAEALLTSAELSRCLGLEHEHVKKQLKWLKASGIIRTVGVNPKCYKFDSYTYRNLCHSSPSDPLLAELLAQLAQSEA